MSFGHVVFDQCASSFSYPVSMSFNNSWIKTSIYSSVCGEVGGVWVLQEKKTFEKPKKIRNNNRFKSLMIKSAWKELQLLDKSCT